MKTIILAAAAAFTLAPLGLATPAFAHMGMEHGGCAAGQTFTTGNLAVTGAYSRATLPQAKSAGGFMVITNTGTTPDRLIGARTENAQLSQVHEMRMDGDIMKMGEVEGGLEIPAGGSVTLESGGFHIMMMGLVQPLKVDECLALTLTFEKAGELPVELNIGATDADAAPEGHAHH